MDQNFHDVAIVDMGDMPESPVSIPGLEQLSTGGGGGGGLVGTHLTPSVDLGTDLEDERPTPIGSPVAAIDEGMSLSPTLGADVEVALALLEMGIIPHQMSVRHLVWQLQNRSPLEYFPAVGTFCRVYHASGPPDTESDGGGSGCSWVGGVLPGWGYRGGWGPPGIARFVSGGPL